MRERSNQDDLFLEAVTRIAAGHNLAMDWELMTGVEPICQANDKEYSFYSACVEVWRLLAIEPAEKSSVRDWIREMKKSYSIATKTLTDNRS
jgi:hypothetical protein